MSVDVVIRRDISFGGKSLTSRISLSSGSGYEIDETIPAGTVTNLAVNLVIDVSKMVAFYLKAEGGNITLNFNDVSGGSPSLTKTLVNGQSWSWDNLSLHANPFGSTDVTGVYVTKSGSATPRLRGYVVIDPTASS